MHQNIPDFIVNLNTTTNATWAPLDGLYALTKVTNEANAGISFHPATGVVIKAFFNEATGEIKLYPAKLFGFPENTNI